MVYDWDESDLQRTLDIGSAYYELRQTHQGDSLKNFLERNQLLNQLTFEHKFFDISFIDVYSGTMNSEHLQMAFADLVVLRFNSFGCHTAVLFFHADSSIITCLLEEFVYVDGFDLYPIDVKITSADEGVTERQYAHIMGRN